jgi:hypothetical protein
VVEVHKLASAVSFSHSDFHVLDQCNRQRAMLPDFYSATGLPGRFNEGFFLRRLQLWPIWAAGNRIFWECMGLFAAPRPRHI